jgi:hypothetical protein|tara:strand:+ start:42 stop:143 length:102 start_codon:yes stop_codon:yes gene_type:complete
VVAAVEVMDKVVELVLEVIELLVLVLLLYKEVQ